MHASPSAIAQHLRMELCSTIAVAATRSTAACSLAVIEHFGLARATVRVARAVHAVVDRIAVGTRQTRGLGDERRAGGLRGLGVTALERRHEVLRLIDGTGVEREAVVVRRARLCVETRARAAVLHARL